MPDFPKDKIRPWLLFPAFAITRNDNGSHLHPCASAGDIYHMLYADSVAPDQPAHPHPRATLSAGMSMKPYSPDKRTV